MRRFLIVWLTLVLIAVTLSVLAIEVLEGRLEAGGL